MKHVEIRICDLPEFYALMAAASALLDAVENAPEVTVAVLDAARDFRSVIEEWTR
jgi:hypothetical protein